MASDRRLWFTHKCRICSYMFTSERDLLHHEKTHTKRTFSCETCDAVFDAAEQLNDHADSCVASVECANVNQQRVCKACGNVFDAVRDLYKHYLECHMEASATEKNSASEKDQTSQKNRLQCSCGTCGATFACAASLKVHLWRNHNVNIGSKQNIGITNTKNGQKTGSQRTDAGSTTSLTRTAAFDADKPFKCKMCNWAFKYDFSLHSHLETHAEKQRQLVEMLRANSGSAAADDGIETTVTSPVVKRTVLYLRLKTTNTAVNNAQVHTTTSCRASEMASVPIVSGSTVSGAKRIRLSVSDECSDVQESCCDEQAVPHGTPGNTEHIPEEQYTEAEDRLLSGQLTPCSVSSVSKRTGACQPGSSGDDDLEPRYACKLCNFRCCYDFSYVAHLSQHAKLKELEIDDLHSHLVAVGPTLPPSTFTANSNLVVDGQSFVGNPGNMFIAQPSVSSAGEFAFKMIDDASQLTYLQASQLATSDGINYILVCPSDIVQSGGFTEQVVTDGIDGVTDCETIQTSDEQSARGDDVLVVVDDTSPFDDPNMHLLHSSQSDDIEQCVDGVVQDMPLLLDSIDGETFYVINEDDMQLHYQMDADTVDAAVNIETEITDGNGCNDIQEDGSCVVQDGLQTNDVGIAVVDENSDNEDDDVYSCYFCNATFTRKSSLQEHIMSLHVDAS